MEIYAHRMRQLMHAMLLSPSTTKSVSTIDGKHLRKKTRKKKKTTEEIGQEDIRCQSQCRLSATHYIRLHKVLSLLPFFFHFFFIADHHSTFLLCERRINEYEQLTHIHRKNKKKYDEWSAGFMAGFRRPSFFFAAAG